MQRNVGGAATSLKRISPTRAFQWRPSDGPARLTVQPITLSQVRCFVRLSRCLAVAALVVAPIGIAATTVHAGDGTVEVKRIRVHFDSVLRELAARDARGLSAEQRANRAELTRTLTAYRDRGVFPHNYDFPGQAVPYFVDRKTGTLCAVANLLEKTGRRDIVDRVATTNNNVWVAELAGDTAFTAWLDANGLTLAEAARIQVPYAAGRRRQRSRFARSAFGITTPLALGAAVTTSMWNVVANRDGHQRVVSWTGVISGVTAIAAGALVATKPDLPRKFQSLGYASAGVGALSLGLSASSIHRHREIVSAEREAARKREVAQATITPIVTADHKAGVSLAVRF